MPDAAPLIAAARKLLKDAAADAPMVALARQAVERGNCKLICEVELAAIGAVVAILLDAGGEQQHVLWRHGQE